MYFFAASIMVCLARWACIIIRSDEHRKAAHVCRLLLVHACSVMANPFRALVISYYSKVQNMLETIELNNTRYLMRCLLCPPAWTRYPTKPVSGSNTGSAGHESMEKENKESRHL